MNQSRRKFFQLCASGLAGTAVAKAMPETKKPEKVDLLIYVRANDSHLVEVVRRNRRVTDSLKLLDVQAKDSGRMFDETVAAINKLDAQISNAN